MPLLSKTPPKHNRFIRKLRPYCLGAFLLACSLPWFGKVQKAGLAIREGKASALKLEQEIPNVSLRGYGKLSGKYWSNSGTGSILEIRCEDEQKAKLTHAKYLSDLGVLPGVRQRSVRIETANIPVLEIEAQGVIGALRSGTTLFIISATDQKTWLQLLARSFSGNVAQAIANSEVEVPMWLDRWDKYGFRFYYRPWETPKGTTPATYDITKEFDFAQKSKAGIVFWSNRHSMATAEGVMSDSWWDWAQDWSREKGLPVGINTMASAFSIPGWLANRYRDELAVGMPQFLGNDFCIAASRGLDGTVGKLPWGDSAVNDVSLASVQGGVRRLVNAPNVTSWLEPHGEVPEGGFHLFTDFGPGSDQIFRQYLKKQYSDTAKLSRAWYGEPGKIKSWGAVRIPELASFAGWNEDARDLKGTWKVGYPVENQTAPDEWFARAFDDSTWPSIEAPGTDRNLFLPKKPAVYRQTIEVPIAWLAKHPRVWLYVWDLNEAWGKPVSLWINGKKLVQEPIQHPIPHRMATEVSASLMPGQNQISLSLPAGYLAYRIYLSAEEPKQYPDLGACKNAQWVDFIGWREWARVESIRRGTEMIREVDPNRQIDFMHPDTLADGIKKVAEEFGGNFKNTGYMGGCWADFLPAQMRGAGLPFSLEPGGPASTLSEFKKQLGLYHTEGIQGLDYFIHLGNIMWPPEIRKHFDQTLPLIQLIGKYHSPRADVAFLFATKNTGLTGFPWTRNPNTNLPSGWSCKGIGEELQWRGWNRDALTEGDFQRGNANKYRVIVDTNTSIMDQELLKEIEEYVRQGGTFVTFAQTGRHTPTVPNAWPIASLTGYEVLSVDKPDGDPANPGSPNQTVVPALGQSIYPQVDPWMKSPHITGLRLKKTASDAQDLLIWKDGTVAAGLRQLGKGRIIQLGCRRHGSVWLGLPPEVLERIFEFQKASRISGHLQGLAKSQDLLMRCYESNNGLYDLWTIWNPSEDKTMTASLLFTGQKVPMAASDVETGRRLAVTDGKLADLAFEPLQTRIFMTARNKIDRAPLEWFDLQRGWWKGTQAISKGFPPFTPRFALPLSADWAWKALAEAENAETLAVPDFDDRAWERRPIGIWNVPGKEGIKRAIFRKTFTVPKEWNAGSVDVWLRSFWNTTFIGKGRIWLDGKLIKDWGADGIVGDEVAGVLTAGSQHTLAVEAVGEGTLNGVRGEAWLGYVPKPLASIDLAGQWIGTKDYLTDTGPVMLPGKFTAKGMRRSIVVPKEYEGKNIVFESRGETPMSILINGKFLSSGGSKGLRNEINITPFILFGKENQIELISSSDRSSLTQAQLNVYTKEIYP